MNKHLLLLKQKGRVYIGLLLFFLGTLGLNGQDIHFTQFYNAPFSISPGLVGVFDGNIRFQSNYRIQWLNPVNFQTVNLSVDKRFVCEDCPSQKGFFSGGLGLIYDQAGALELNNNRAYALGSYTLQDKSGHISYTFGTSLAYHQRAFRPANLTFDNQYNGAGGVNTRIDSRESFPNFSNSYFDMSIGVNWRYQAKDPYEVVRKLDKRTTIDIGAGLFHLFEPDQSLFEEVKVPLPMRAAVYSVGTIQLTKRIDALANFLAQFQTSYMELTYGWSAKYHLNRRPGEQLAVQAGMNFRSHDFGESWGFLSEVDYKDWVLGVSYEFNTSDFQVATRRNGAWEFTLRYIFRKPPPINCNCL